MNGIEAFLPPHWINDEDGLLFINAVTGEKTDVHPLYRYHELRNQFIIEQAVPSETQHFTEDVNANIPNIDDIFSDQNKKEAFFDYHCQWSERDPTGKVKSYGLSIRFISNEKIMVKLDGIDAEWIYSSLLGPSGPLERCDLFIGAKVKVFGRHLTISSASLAAVQWIEKEADKIEKKTEDYRNRILSMGVTPCVKKMPPSTIRNITRSTRITGQRDLRVLRNSLSKLGEQLANLGFSHLLT